MKSAPAWHCLLISALLHFFNSSHSTAFQFQLNQLAFSIPTLSTCNQEFLNFSQNNQCLIPRTVFKIWKSQEKIALFIFDNIFECIRKFELQGKKTWIEEEQNSSGLDWRITKSGLKKWQRHMSTFSSNEKLECGRLRVKVEMWQGAGEVMLVTAINVWRETALRIWLVNWRKLASVRKERLRDSA